MTASGANHSTEFRTSLVRTAEVLGWTHGQVWTVLVGLLLAVPAAIFGLGPALEEVTSPSAAPPRIAAGVPAGTRTIEATPVEPAPAFPPRAVSVSPAPAAFPEPAAAGGGTAAAPLGTAVPGPGRVTAVASRGDRLYVAVDRGAGAAGSVFVIEDDRIRSQFELVAAGITYSRPSGIAVADGTLVVATASPAAVLKLAPSDGAVVAAMRIPDVGACLPLVNPSGCQQAVPDRPPMPQHVAVDDRGDVYVADPGQGCIDRAAAGESKVEAWLCDSAFASAPTADGGGVAGIEATDGRLVVTLANAGLQGEDRVVQIEVRDGRAGARKDLAAGVGGARPAGVAVLPDGRIVVALVSANGVLVLEPDGGEGSSKPLAGVVGPVDVSVSGDFLVVAHAGAGGAGELTRYALEML